MQKHILFIATYLFCLIFLFNSKVFAEDNITKICVDVSIKSLSKGDIQDNVEIIDKDKELPTFVPIVEPTALMTRLLEYAITSRQGYMAVKEGCSSEIVVEMYKLGKDMGWTVFTRYSGNQREIKVEKILFDEIPPFAERVVHALLKDKLFHETLTVDKVLNDDSPKVRHKIKPLGHYNLKFGNLFYFANLPTAKGAAGSETVKDAIRLFNPFIISLGYRGKMEAWAIDTNVYGGLSPVQKSVNKNPKGGHTDLTSVLGISVSILKYATPEGINCWYYGVGSSFQANIYSVLRPMNLVDENNYNITSKYDKTGFGGMNLQFTVGREFLRTSLFHLYLESKLDVPLYYTSLEEDNVRIKSYTPSLGVFMGLIF